MTTKRPKILAVVPNGNACESRHAQWLEADSLPGRERLLAAEWDYIYLGFDSEILDERIFTLAAEYAAYDEPDMFLFSSTARRMPAGGYERPADRFHLLCEAAKDGGLYALGNKLFSRRLFSSIDKPWVTPFLTEAFCRADAIRTLSQPWIAVRNASTPTDAEFSAFIEHYAALAGDGGGGAWRM